MNPANPGRLRFVRQSVLTFAILVLSSSCGSSGNHGSAETRLEATLERVSLEIEAEAPSSLDVQFGDVARLVRFEVTPETAAPGTSLRMVLAWEGVKRTSSDLAAFVHFVGPGTTFQGDHVPGAPERGSSRWEPGRRLVEEYRVRVPDEAPVGSYAVRVGLWNPASGDRLRARAATSFTVRKDAVEIASVALEPRPETLRQLTGSRTRVAWVQDVGAGTDPFASGDQLVLMGLDTDDGRGERAILGTPSNYAKPLITSGGDRIVFSDRNQRKVFVVDWDGTGPREVVDGFALDVWTDPESGVEWVYFASYEDQEKQGRYESVHRVRLDQPESSELVWNHAPVNEDTFQVSADGRRAGGVFPWPEVGIARLPNQGLDRLGRGCWTAMAQDGSDRFWFFDGAHRHVTIVDQRNDRRWEVDVSDAPGVEGHEVYHPRWSNNARILAVTGPYKGAVQGVNRIRSGGENVEIYLGRFAEDARSIETWVQVTHNEQADFFPDVWVEEPGPRVHATRTPAGSDDRDPARAADWPVDRAGLVYVWKNRSSDNEIPGPEGDPPIVCRAEPRDEARFGRHLEMALSDGAFVALDAAERVARALRSSGRFALEALIAPELASQTGVVASLEPATGTPDLQLVQEEEHLVLRFRTSSGKHESTLGRLEAGRAHHVVVSYEPGQLAAWIDGREVEGMPLVDGDLERWEAEHLLFGNSHSGDRDWHGALEGVAIHDRAIDGDEARARFEVQRERLAERTAPSQLVVVARLVETSGIPSPADIEPYRRGLAAHRYAVQEVLDGKWEGDELMAAHWVILDGKVLPSAGRAPGERHQLTLELYDERPDLEGERLTMDGDAFRLPTFYVVESHGLPESKKRAARD